MDAGKDDGITIDESVRFQGTVSRWDNRRGFGYIIPEGKGETDKVFALWRQIESSDEWPALKEGLVVEYYIGKKEGAKRKSQQKFAAKITLEGGNPVTLALDRTYPNRAQRFSGTIKFFDPRKGFGFVLPSADFTFDGTAFKTGEGNIHIAREDIKTTANIAPSLKKGTEVEFTLYKTSDEKKGYSAADVTKPGGAQFAEEDLMTKHTGWPRRRKVQKGKKGFGAVNMKMLKKMMQQQMGGMMMMGGNPYMMMNPMMMMGGKRKKKGRKNKKKSW